MNSIKLHLLKLLPAGMALLGAATVHAADLTVTVRGVGAATGEVKAAIYQEAHWLKSGQAVQATQAPASAPETVLSFRDLPPGRYGVSLYHDQNGNGRLDTNAVGMPTEPYGASRDARGRMGPPRFVDAVIELPAESAITVQLR